MTEDRPKGKKPLDTPYEWGKADALAGIDRSDEMRKVPGIFAGYKAGLEAGPVTPEQARRHRLMLAALEDYPPEPSE